MYKHTCQLCGMEFESPSARAKYCIYCRDKAQVLRNKAYKEKKQAGEAVEQTAGYGKVMHGEAVAIGSEQVCSLCGKSYTVTAGSQKYCKECQGKQARSKKISSNAQYAKANYKTLKLYVSAEERDAIKAYAESLGMSVNKLMLTALEEFQKNHNSIAE